MPIYEYKCQSCGNHLEAMQKISDAPLTECPKCGGKLEKQWSRTGFQFKGTGWYVTDYAGKSATESGGEAKSETPKTEEKKTSASGESTASGDGASKSETKTASSDKSKP